MQHCDAKQIGLSIMLYCASWYREREREAWLPKSFVGVAAAADVIIAAKFIESHSR